MASLEYRGRRGDGTHAWRVVEYVHGDKVTRMFRTPTDSKRAAQRRVPQILVDLQTERTRQVESVGTVAELVDDWYQIKARDCSPTTLDGYKRHSERFKARLGRTKVVNLTGKHLDDWYSELMADGMKVNTLHHLHRVVRAVLYFGRKKRRMPSTAVDEVTLPSVEEFELKLPTRDVIDLLVESTSGEWGRCVRLLRETAMRAGELAALQWTDIDGTFAHVRRAAIDVKGGVQVKEPKGKRSRRAFLSARAIEVLKEQRQMPSPGTSPWVFPSFRRDPSGSTPRSPGSLSTNWYRHATTNHGVAMRLHDLRHAWATEALAAGIPLHVVQQQLGHADPSTTLRIYGHATDTGMAMLAKYMNGLDELGPGG